MIKKQKAILTYVDVERTRVTFTAASAVGDLREVYVLTATAHRHSFSDVDLDQVTAVYSRQIEKLCLPAEHTQHNKKRPVSVNTGDARTLRGNERRQ